MNYPGQYKDREVHIQVNINMLFTDREVHIEKNFAQGLECTDRGRRPSTFKTEGKSRYGSTKAGK